MSAKENNSEVAVDKVDGADKNNSDAKCELKGTKRPADVSNSLFVARVF